MTANIQTLLTIAWNYLTSTSKPHRDSATTASEVDTVALCAPVTRIRA
jgi:hypothetical protein